MTSLPRIRVARANDADAITAIYAPLVRDTVISFELEPPSVDEMSGRIAKTLATLPWLVSEDAGGAIDGYVYAVKHRDRAAYQWAVDTSVYVHAEARGRGVGRHLYVALLDELRALGYTNAFAGIALPNAGSVGLHEAVGFTLLGVYRRVGYKHGAWHDVGKWQCRLGGNDDVDDTEPAAPRPFDAR